MRRNQFLAVLVACAFAAFGGSLVGSSYLAPHAARADIAVGNGVPLANIPNSALTNSTISGVALGSNLFALTPGSHLTGGAYNGSAAIALATDCASANTASTIVCRDGSGAFSMGPLNIASDNDALHITGTGTNRAYIHWQSGGGNSYAGVECSTGGCLFSGSTAYETTLGTDGANGVCLASGNTCRLHVTATGPVTTTNTFQAGASIGCGTNGTPHVECGQVSSTLGTCLVTTLCTVGTFTFATSYAAAPKCVVSNATAVAVSAAAIPDVSAVGTTTATVSVYAVAALTGDVITVNITCAGA